MQISVPASQQRRRVVDERRGPIDERRAGTDASRGAGATSGTGSSGADSTSTNRPRSIDVDERLAPSVVEHGEPEREVVEQLVGDDHAVDRTGREIGTRLDRRRDAVHVAPPRPRRPRTAGRRAHAGRAASDRAGERARARTDVDHGERVRPPDPLPFGVEVPGEHGAEQRADLGRRDEVAPPPCRATVGTHVEPRARRRARGP